LVYLQGRAVLVDRAHNLVLDTLATSGVLGLLASASLVEATLLTGLRAFLQTPDRGVHLVLAAALAGAAGAQVSTSYDLSWWVLDGGNGRPDSDSYALYSVLGQGIVGFASGRGLGVDSGQPPMVPGVPVSALVRHEVYLPAVLRSAP
jgi:hypothetical protein